MEEIRLVTPRGELGAKRTVNGKQPVLGIHGWLDNASSFDLLAPELAVDMVAIDLPGHGFSYHAPQSSPYHLIDWVSELELSLSALSWPKVSLIAHSLGSAVALFTAALAPERIEKIVLLDAAGPLTTIEEDAFDRATRHRNEWAIVTSEGDIHRPLTEWIEARQKTTLSLTGACLTREHAERLVRRAFQETPDGWRARYDTRLKAPMLMGFSLKQICSFLKQVRCPVMLLRATQGITRPDYGWEERAKNLKELEIRMIQGDHYFHLSGPLLIAHEIERFLKKD